MAGGCREEGQHASAEAWSEDSERSDARFLSAFAGLLGLEALAKQVLCFFTSSASVKP